MSHAPVRNCPRCGIRRQVHHGRTDNLCRDCQAVDPGWPDTAKERIA